MKLVPTHAVADPFDEKVLVDIEAVGRSSRDGDAPSGERGLNDGLALPVVMWLIAVMGQRQPNVQVLIGELALGIGIGIAVSWGAARIEESRMFGVAAGYEPLFVFSIGLLILAIASLVQANKYLAAFAAAVVVATRRPGLRDEFSRFGDDWCAC
jgi:sodium/hydrogen antiporter